MQDDPFVLSEEYEIHPIAMILPSMEGEEFDKFKEDILGQGLIEPVVIFQGKILDGRNRYNACKELGISITAVNWEGGMDPVEYVVSKNIHRRQLTPGQRSIASAKALDYHSEQAKIRQREAGGDRKSDEYKKTVVAPVQQPIATQEPKKSAFEKKAISEAGKMFNVSGRSVAGAKVVLDHGTPEEIKAVESGKSGIKPIEKAVRERVKMNPEMPKKETPKAKPVFNETNDNIEWAPYSWNPVTGCKMGCPYCYARDIGMRFNNTFEPQFHPERLEAPKNTKAKSGKPNNVFVCSMADLFGDWVPTEWIEAVIANVAINPQWNFLFLTKNPKRYLEFEFPKNCWLGATADTQSRADSALEAFGKMYGHIRFLSCEPLMGPVALGDDPPVDWVIIGGRSKSSGMPEGQPEWEWVEDLLIESRSFEIPVYFKPNLIVRPKMMPS